MMNEDVFLEGKHNEYLGRLMQIDFERARGYI